MDIILNQIKEKYPFLSETHKMIAEYIINNRDILDSLTIRDIAKSAFCSISTVNAFCKKLGYNGFSEFKFVAKGSNNSNTNILINLFETIDNNVSINSINTVAQLILNSNNIFILSTGMSRSIAYDFYLRLKKVKSSKVFFNPNIDEPNKYLNQITEDDIVLLISNSGESRELIKFCKKLSSNIITILLSNRDKNTLSKEVKYIISTNIFYKTFVTEKFFPKNSRYALLYITDLIFERLIDIEGKNKSELILNNLNS